MNWREFGKLIRELRRALATRLGRSVTQADLEQMCGFDGERRGIIGRLERGELRCMNEQVLVTLANTFHLTRLERREFFLAANGVSIDHIYHYPGAPTPEHELERVLRSVRRVPLPVMITDVFTDVVAANRALMNLYGDEHIIQAIREGQNGMLANVLYFLFHPRFRFRQMFRREEDWRNLLVADVQFFRRSSLQYRSRPYWQYLMYRFMESPHEDPEMQRLFTQFWALAEVEQVRDGNTTRFYDLRHPRLGALRYVALVSEEVTSRGPLYVITHIPVDDSTRRAFEGLMRRQGGSEWVTLAPWPVERKRVPQHGWRPRRA